jgi:hypothetical protein
MSKITEQEAERLDELFTNTTPTVDFDKPGLFARQKAMVVALDDFASRYIFSKSIATKKSPSELISDMIKKDMGISA